MSLNFIDIPIQKIIVNSNSIKFEVMACVYIKMAKFFLRILGLLQCVTGGNELEKQLCKIIT